MVEEESGFKMWLRLRQLVIERHNARMEKDFVRADAIRDVAITMVSPHALRCRDEPGKTMFYGWHPWMWWYAVENG